MRARVRTVNMLTKRKSFDGVRRYVVGSARTRVDSSSCRTLARSVALTTSDAALSLINTLPITVPFVSGDSVINDAPKIDRFAGAHEH